jgi:hypothetical protein
VRLGRRLPGRRRSEDDLAGILRRLSVADHDVRQLLGSDGEGARAVVERLWPRPPASPGEHNDLAVAYAWLRHWDGAMAEVAASEIAPGATRGDRERAAGNRRVVEDARRAALYN